jgi:hypothetical protein
MSVLPLRFVNGELKMNVPRLVDTPILLPKLAPVAVVEVPTAAPEPEPTVAPSEVEAPAEVSEAAPEAGLVPENPPTE